MVKTNLLNKAEEQRLVQRIVEFERHTSVELRIHIAAKASKGGAFEDAKKVFVKLGIQNTKLRNGLLVFIAVKSHDIVCLGDDGIHQKVGQAFWQKGVELLKESFSKGDYYIGFDSMLGFFEKELKQHFPPETDQGNELSNEISFSE